MEESTSLVPERHLSANYKEQDKKRIKCNNKTILTKQGECDTFLSALKMHNERGMLLKAAALV